MRSSSSCRRNAIRLLPLPRGNPAPQLPPGCRQSLLPPTLPPPPKIPTASSPLSEDRTALQPHLHRQKKPTKPFFLSAVSCPSATTQPPAPKGPPPAPTTTAAVPLLFHPRSRRQVCRPVSFTSTSAACQDITKEKLHIGIRWFSTTDVSSHVVLEMPALSPTMNQGNIAKWRKKEGDKINMGDVICEIETDKAVLEFESIEEGFLAKILAPEGSKDVPVGQPIAITVEDLDEIKNIPATLSGNLEKTESSDKVVAEKSSEKDVEHKGSSLKTNFNRVSPAAKLLISEFGLDISSLKASGPRGTLLKSDILEVIKSGRVPSKSSGLAQENSTASVQHSTPSSPPLPSSSSNLAGALLYEDIPHTQIRKVIARRLVESKQNTPHFYSSADVILDPLLAFRNVLKEQHNVKVSINDIIIKAVAVSLQSVPEANAIWNDKEGKASLCDTIDISIAVATEKGLMTPIVRNANQKSLSAISLEVKELAEKARVGKLTPDQFQGGTFSISNLGMFPVDRFCAIINPPQACILAVGRGNMVVEPVIGDDGVERPTLLTKMCLNLSADHRVYDSEIGGKLLSTISANLNNVQRLLL